MSKNPYRTASGKVRGWSRKPLDADGYGPQHEQESDPVKGGKVGQVKEIIAAQKMPWRESQTLSGVIGEHIVMARQAADGAWLVGAATNEDPRWWHAFWNRSWISISEREEIAPPATGDPRRVTQAYALQRFINACAGRGNLPIKFNGTLFTVDEVFDPDYRRWGGPYWLQNTRLGQENRSSGRGRTRQRISLEQDRATNTCSGHPRDRSAGHATRPVRVDERPADTAAGSRNAGRTAIGNSATDHGSGPSRKPAMDSQRGQWMALMVAR